MPVSENPTSRFPNTVTPINTTTNSAGPAIKVGSDPTCIAITPNGKTAYVNAVVADDPMAVLGAPIGLGFGSPTATPAAWPSRRLPARNGAALVARLRRGLCK